MSDNGLLHHLPPEGLSFSQLREHEGANHIRERVVDTTPIYGPRDIILKDSAELGAGFDVPGRSLEIYFANGSKLVIPCVLIPTFGANMRDVLEQWAPEV